MREVGIYQVWTGKRYLIKIGHQMKKLETSLGSKSAEPNSIEKAQIFKGKNNCVCIFNVDWF